MEPKERANLAVLAAEDKKARDIEVLDVKNLTVIADYFVICSGGSTLQVRAIADNIVEKMAEAGQEPLHTEGYSVGRWILLDYGDVIIHVFVDEDREYYDIERLWRDATQTATPASGQSGPVPQQACR